MAATLNAATFMGKNFSTIQSVVKNFEDLTLKQMFDVTAQLVNNQDEINGLDKILWGKNSWKRLSLIGDETVINLQSTKVYVFSDSVLCLGRVLQHPESNEAWKNRVAGIQSGKSYRDYDAINGESTELEWNIFPGFTTLQLCGNVNDLLSHLGQTPESFTGRILFVSMFNDISCDRKGNKEECLANARVVKVLAKKFGIGQWSFIGPGSEKKWYSSENGPQGAWDHIAEEMLLEFAESGHPTFRATTPLSRGQLKSKGRGKLSIHFAADDFTIDTIFRIILSVNQLSVYGAVAAICEEFENHQDGSGELEILMGQSIVLSEIKAEVPLQNENPLNHQILWQQHIEVGWIIGKVGTGSSWQLSWHASSAILAQGRRCQQAVKIFRNMFCWCVNFEMPWRQSECINRQLAVRAKDDVHTGDFLPSLGPSGEIREDAAWLQACSRSNPWSRLCSTTLTASW